MCSACAAKRTHTPDDWALHPYAGHGYAQGQGWTHPDLALRESDGLAAPGLERGRSDLPTSSAGAATSLRQNLGGDWVEVKAAPVGGKA